MKCLVTVGTSSFNSLLKKIDTINNGIEFTVQSGNSSYLPKNHNFKPFFDDFEKVVNDSDVIITHAGAGSTYSFLEMRKRLIVVPNLERADKHQTDLANYVSEKNLALVCYNVDDLIEAINKLDSMRFNIYKKDQFNKFEIIDDLINKELVIK